MALPSGARERQTLKRRQEGQPAHIIGIAWQAATPPVIASGSDLTPARQAPHDRRWSPSRANTQRLLLALANAD